MKDDTNQYWKSLEERAAVPGFQETAANEFADLIPANPPATNRRDFLAAAGFAFAGMALAGCSRTPERLALPMINQPEEMTPGRSLHYASTCQACSSGCGLLVKCRDGRPIKLEGNPEHALSRGGLCAVGQASILGLYDRQRLQGPRKNQIDSTWQEVDADIRDQLDAIRRQRGRVRILSNTILGPTTQEQIQAFLNRFTQGGCDARHVVYDAISSAAILDAHQQTHGLRVLPHYRLDRAEIIASFDADFLGTWISPVEFTRDYHAGRSLAGNLPRCSLHIQLESRLSLTGAKADQRHRVLPGEIGLLLTHLAKILAERAGVAWMSGTPEALSFPSSSLGTRPGVAIEHLARQLWDARGRCLVLCGSQDVGEQKLCNLINHMLGAYGATIDIDRPSLQRQGNDAELERLIQQLKAGDIAALFLLDCNPVYDLPGRTDWESVLQRESLLCVSCTERIDETAALVKYVCPHPHYLASWNDAEPIRGMLSLAQPTFVPLGNTRTILESLAAWRGISKSARQLVQEHWQANFFTHQTRERDLQTFWDKAVHDGFVEITPQRTTPQTLAVSSVQSITRAERPGDGSFSLVLHANLGMLDGRHAYNPWLQELPDPITKIAWDNYASLSPAAAQRLGIREGDVVRVEADLISLDLPAVLQPGQHDQVVAVPLGYGSKLSERFGDVGPSWLEARPTLNGSRQVGKNAAPFLTLERQTLTCRRTVQITRTGQRHLLASTQTHHSINVPAHLAPQGQARRPMILETTVAGLHQRQPAHEPLANLWPPDHPVTGPRWGMVIDLSACTGCSACVMACQVENNIPVVGKDEIYRQREMHWIRIDRYYSDDGNRAGEVDVAFQPMMCQHCGNAPCETVCPVLATAHSSEGLNQQVYNRCVGTRYCANNCPYKVRRFNWFDYAHEDAVENLVLNPDVTVRSRGVMEKCSFCVQRIQEAKLESRRLALPLAEANLQTACQQSCPAQAIYFGDLNDPNSRVSQLLREGRGYQVLAELNVQPAVSYLKLVRNRPAVEPGASATGGPHG
jgi:MoCo/4Fe-4S cofactor protein with predicted Tat translocation signal